MITRIKVKNFKSLVDFEISGLSKFNCFIGLNGAGKTTLLQFLDFLRVVLTGRVKEWFEQHRWKPGSILSLGSTKRSVEFEVDIEDSNVLVTWEGRFNTMELRCVYEQISVWSNGEKKSTLLFDDNKLKVHGNDYPLPPGFRQFGSIFALLNESPRYLLELSDIRIFGVLSPMAIATASQVRTGMKSRDVQANGSGLMGFVSQLSAEKQKQLFEKLKEFYPPLQSCKIEKQPFGLRNLLFNEIGNAYYEASHLSYGTLRLLVILSQLYSDGRCIVFDEIENGINQELMGRMIDLLQDFDEKQVMVTTHSSLVLNYLSDEKAIESVIFLFKDARGGTKAVKFFEIEEMSSKLKTLGPGEVMADTDLEKLSKKLSVLDG